MACADHEDEAGLPFHVAVLAALVLDELASEPDEILADRPGRRFQRGDGSQLTAPLAPRLLAAAR